MQNKFSFLIENYKSLALDAPLHIADGNDVMQPFQILLLNFFGRR